MGTIPEGTCVVCLAPMALRNIDNPEDPENRYCQKCKPKPSEAEKEKEKEKERRKRVEEEYECHWF